MTAAVDDIYTVFLAAHRTAEIRQRLAAEWSSYGGWSVPTTPQLATEILDKLYERFPRDRLQIKRVAISSPGLISFEGLGEAINAFREFVKDLSYRNKQEREMGELRLQAARRALNATPPVGAPGLPAAEIELLAGRLPGPLRRLERLERQGKLLNIGDHIDADPISLVDE